MNAVKALLIGLLTLSHVSGQSQTPKIKVVLLGTFHYRETPDKNKTDFPDLFSSRRQKELEQIAVKLAEFGVDKFFVEMQFTHQQTLDSLFNAYQNGKLTDTTALRDEITQLAFRTAKLTNCKLIASDNRQELPYDKITAYEQQHENDSIYPYSFFFSEPTPFKLKQKRLEELSLSDYYIQLNSV
jgi:Skp family chaperone for outer membrane proteins